MKTAIKAQLSGTGKKIASSKVLPFMPVEPDVTMTLVSVSQRKRQQVSLTYTLKPKY